MFIVWGTKSRQEDGGVVGDWCEGCRAPNFHKLTHYFKVSHVYYIPLGKGQHVGTTRQCTQCGTTSSCTASAYSRALTHQEALGRGIDQVLEATNPPLLAQVHKQRALEYQIAQRITGGQQAADGLAPAALPARQADHRLLTALQTLGAMDARQQNVSQFLDRLQKWDYLTPSEGEVLLHEINAFVAEDRAMKSALYLLRLLPTPTPKWIGYVACLAAVMILFVVAPFLPSLLWGAFFTATVIVCCFIIAKKASKKAVRAWVERSLAPKLRESDVDARYFVSLLAELRGSGRGYEEKIAAMARNVDVIADELHTRGLLALEAETQTQAQAAGLSPPPMQN